MSSLTRTRTRHTEIGRPAADEYKNSELYRGYHLPSTTRGFVGLEKMEIAGRLLRKGEKTVPRQTIEVLDGRMRQSAKARRTGLEEHYRLVPENLPPSAARSQVYYYKNPDLKE